MAMLVVMGDLLAMNMKPRDTGSTTKKSSFTLIQKSKSLSVSFSGSYRPVTFLPTARIRPSWSVSELGMLSFFVS